MLHSVLGCGNVFSLCLLKHGYMDPPKVGISAILINSSLLLVIYVTLYVVTVTWLKTIFSLTLLSSCALPLCQSHFPSFVLDRSSLITSAARAKHFAFLSCHQTLASRPPQPSCRRWLRESAAAQQKATAAPQFPLYHFPFRLRCVLAESRRASFI